ncbi:MAG: hypothetical protein HGN29_07015 [Asgard group archaeon]|nr:hypothetical protein [Asgard group archaeon]
MKKRGVSPVIATILLIALVTAAAAIVFLVVIPMLNPAPKAIVQESNVVLAGDGLNYTVTITIQAEGNDILYTDVSASPIVSYLVLDSTEPFSISNGATKQIVFTGSFTIGIEYTLTINFSSGESTAIGTAVFTPS